jgi:DNA-binding response OmpR family regulator
MQRQESLLIVEDEHTLRTLVAQFLRQAGYAVHEAGDGQEGVDRFRQVGPVGLVLLDLNLPRLGGVEVCQEIRRIDPSQPVLIVSGAILADHERALCELGVSDYLTKPYHPRALLNLVERLTRSFAVQAR